MAGLLCLRLPSGENGSSPWSRVCSMCVCFGPRLKGQGFPGKALLLEKAEAPEGKPTLTSAFQTFVCITCINIPLTKQVTWLYPRSRSKEVPQPTCKPESPVESCGPSSVRERWELGPRTQSVTVANSVTAQYFCVGENLMEIFFYVIFLNEGIELTILRTVGSWEYVQRP